LFSALKRYKQLGISEKKLHIKKAFIELKRRKQDESSTQQNLDDGKKIRRK
jgi:hypothetical protein